MGGPREAPSVPTRTRPHRSLPALLVVVALIAAAGPISAARPQTEALRLTPDRERAGSSEIQATGGNDRGPRSATNLSRRDRARRRRSSRPIGRPRD
jgi:hypothetical protein